MKKELNRQEIIDQFHHGKCYKHYRFRDIQNQGDRSQIPFQDLVDLVFFILHHLKGGSFDTRFVFEEVPPHLIKYLEEIER